MVSGNTETRHDQEYSPKDWRGGKGMREFFSPQMVDQMIRQAIQFCWMGLPRKKRSIKEVEKQVRRIVDPPSPKATAGKPGAQGPARGFRSVRGAAAGLRLGA